MSGGLTCARQKPPPIPRVEGSCHAPNLLSPGAEAAGPARGVTGRDPAGKKEALRRPAKGHSGSANLTPVRPPAVGLRHKLHRPALRVSYEHRGPDAGAAQERQRGRGAEATGAALPVPPRAARPATPPPRPHTYSGRGSELPASRLHSSSRSLSAAEATSPPLPAPPFGRCRAPRLAMASVRRAERGTDGSGERGDAAAAGERCPPRPEPRHAQTGCAFPDGSGPTAARTEVGRRGPPCLPTLRALSVPPSLRLSPFTFQRSPLCYKTVLCPPPC